VIGVTSASLASFGRRPYGRRGCCRARLTLGRLAWQAGAGQLPAGSGTVTVEVHGTAGAWEPSGGGRDHDHVAG
jgi:hypothetical protein